MAGEFSPDFAEFLRRRYPRFDFRGSEKGINAGFGGKLSSSEVVRRIPIVFVHGNSDRAIGGPMGGWSDSVKGFLAAGYQPGELYGLTWGHARKKMALFQYHSYKNLNHVRNFIEAVMAYTGAEKVNVICHSMGVTLARKAIKGGWARGMIWRRYSLGEPLTKRINVFIGIAGANQGLASAFGAFFFPTTGLTNGLHPKSRFLAELNSHEGFEGDHVYSIWSHRDQLVSHKAKAPYFPEQTCRIPGETGTFELPDLGHLELKSDTVSKQLELILKHEP